MDEATNSVSDETYLNRAYLFALKSAAAKSIPDACAKFGVDANFAAQFADLSIQDIEKFCTDGIVLFKPAINPGQFLKIFRIQDANTRTIMARLSIKPN